jgi:hypothetical protein
LSIRKVLAGDTTNQGSGYDLLSSLPARIVAWMFSGQTVLLFFLFPRVDILRHRVVSALLDDLVYVKPGCSVSFPILFFKEKLRILLNPTNTIFGL